MGDEIYLDHSVDTKANKAGGAGGAGTCYNSLIMIGNRQKYSTRVKEINYALMLPTMPSGLSFINSSSTVE